MSLFFWDILGPFFLAPTVVHDKNNESIMYNNFVGVWFEKANNRILVLTSWTANILVN